MGAVAIGAALGIETYVRIFGTSSMLYPIRARKVPSVDCFWPSRGAIQSNLHDSSTQCSPRE